MPPKQVPEIRITVHFSGHVQGVGFRYQAVRVAKRYIVSGLVQNLSDGRVRIVVEGAPEQVEPFVHDLSDHMTQYICQASEDRGAATGEFGPPDRGGLRVRY